MEVKLHSDLIDVGPIPADWILRPLGEIGKWYSGGTPSMKNVDYWFGETPWASPKDMKVPRLFDTADHITTKAISDGARVLPIGSVLFVIRGMILAHSFPVARSETPLAFNQDMKALIVSNEINSNFVLYWLIGHGQKLLGLTTESTHGTKRLSPETIYRVRITLPPTLTEQEAIAGALSDADAWIESLEQLIAKKRQIKQGAMQELLTGKRRLPGFSAEWEVSTVGHEFEIKLGKMLDSEKNFGVSKPFIGNRAVQWNRIDINDLATVPMSRSDIERFRLRKGDLLVCEGGEVGRAAIWDAPISECYYQKALHRLRPVRGFSSRLMVGLLRLWSDCGVFSNFVTQTSIAHLPREKFMEMPLPVPSPPEQIAIAELLSEIDAEINALESKVAKAREIKQGMMQELLTGRIRLV